MYIKNSETREWFYDFIIIGILLTIFYTAWLGSYPLFTPDEGRYSEVAREMVATGDYITPRVDGVAFLDKPILYYWLQATAIHFFGIHEWALRIFPAFFGMLGCMLVYFFGRMLFDRRTGILSSIILATTPLYFGCAHYADLNLEVAVFITGTLLTFLTATFSVGKRRALLLFASYIFSALAFLTKGMIGIAFPVMIIGAWIISLWQWRLLLNMRLMSGLFVFVAIVMPWYYLVQKANPEFLHYFFVTQQVNRFLSTSKFNNPSPFWFYIPIIFIGFFPWVIFLYQGIKKSLKQVWQSPSAYSKELFLLLWVAIVFVFFSIPTSKTVSYILPLFPALALLTGKYFSTLWDKATSKELRLSSSGLIIAGSLLVSALYVSWRLHLVDYPADFNLHMLVIIAIMIANILMTLLLLLSKHHYYKVFMIFTSCALSSFILLLVLVNGAVYLNHDTAKPLAMYLKKSIAPRDEVVTYFKYYQDIPVYLERRVSIVANWSTPNLKKDNWLRELWYGKAFQNTDDWLISEKEFWQRWYSQKRLYVFVNSNYFIEFQRKSKHFYFFGKHNDIILLSNKII